MKWKTMNVQTRLYLISAVVLLLGLSSSAWIYLANRNDSEIGMGYEIVDGNNYLVNPENSKKYIHDLELMGGKSAVLADELSRWFGGLWHGQTLAFTIAVITLFISLGFFLIARTSPSGLEPKAHDGNSNPC